MIKEWLHKKCAAKSEQVCPIRIYRHPCRLHREGLAQWFASWGLKTGVEIGVRDGEFSEILLTSIPGLKLFCVDPWSTTDKSTTLIGQEQQDIHYQVCMKRLSQYSGAKIMKMTSMQAVHEFADQSIDFVYIDGSHEFDDIMMDVIEWSKKVRTDGIVSGHDYYRFRNAGIVQAIDLYTYMHKIDEWFLTDDHTPSFFWAKP